ncbi:hypothetical protein MtrunA17_Chr6g0448961 [Medicago truncatula]|nr:hypothetical protein MtrunA17_Chr6g0448961 [Medicago truncatula]
MKLYVVKGPMNMFVACMQSGRILSKFWGDEQDTDADSTFDLESELEAHKLIYEFPDASHYLAPSSEPAKKSKRGRPKKQKSPKDKLAITARFSLELFLIVLIRVYTCLCVIIYHWVHFYGFTCWKGNLVIHSEDYF